MSSLLGQGKDYFELVKSIGESKSKQEEDRIIAEEIVFLKKAINQSGVSKKKMRELVIRAIYVEMLGQDASYAYIRAVELCASTSITQKKAGYLAASLCLSPDHEFRFMLVNQIQRDMKSSNVLEITTALTAVSKLVTEDMIPAVIGDVLNLLKHDMDAVRKKAVSAMHRFYQMDKRSVLEHVDKMRRALCDKDPAVMGATLPLFLAMISDDVQQFKDLVPSFVVILKQIIDHRLPRDFDYHRIPAPWVQMSLLKVLAVLGRGDQTASEGMYEVLADVLKRADTGINVGYAIVYECIQTITSIYPNKILLDAAASAISRFIRSESHNLKYIGIKGLAEIVKDHPQYAADHQLAVIDCLEDPDETLKHKTLELLFRMTNSVNVEFIVEKLLSFLSTSSDDHFRSELVQQITQCAERFAPSNTWYVQTIIRVFQLAGDKVKLSVAQTLTQLIAEGAAAEDDDEDDANNKDDELRAEAVEHFLDLLDQPKLPAILSQTMAWVLGEYGYLSVSASKEEIMEKLCSKLLQGERECDTKAATVTAIAKLIAQSGKCPSKVLQSLQFYSQSHSLDLQQRCLEVLALLKHSEAMADVLPVDASCEDIDIDESLSIVNAFVHIALQRGAKPYALPPDWDGFADDGTDKKASLKVTPYAAPRMPPAVTPNLPAAGAAVAAAPSGAVPGVAPSTMLTSTASLTPATGQGNQLLATRGNAVWGKKVEPPPPPPAPAAPAAPAHSPSSVPVSAESDHHSPAHQPYVPSSTVHLIPSGNNIWSSSGNAQPPAASANAHVAAAPVPPPAPRELTEKEKMAAALFGGVSKPSSASTASSLAAKRRASTATSTPITSPTSAATTSPLPAAATPTSTKDLFSGMSATAPSSSSSASAPKPTAGSSSLLDMSDDLLAISHSAPVSAPVATHLHSPAPAPAPVLSANILDLSTMHSPPPPVTSHAQHTSMHANVISDVFGNMDLSAGSPVKPAESSLRPLMINTADYGRRWGTCRCEAKQPVSTASWPRLDLELLRRAIPSSWHHVESIVNTQEAIFAAMSGANPATAAVVLMHIKLQPGRRACDVLIKSSNQELCVQELSFIVRAIETFRG